MARDVSAQAFPAFTAFLNSQLFVRARAGRPGTEASPYTRRSIRPESHDFPQPIGGIIA